MLGRRSGSETTDLGTEENILAGLPGSQLVMAGLIRHFASF
jgi:hypothetical protein